MDLSVVNDKTYTRQEFKSSDLGKAEYFNCEFNTCDFENSDLSNIHFIECRFINCNLSNANITNVLFNDVCFEDCKLLGLQFQNCNTFLLNFSFKDCQLNFATFATIEMPSTSFYNCNLEAVDFSEANLKAVQFYACDFKNAVFERTNLEKANLYSSYNITLNPSINNVTKAVFSIENCQGLLQPFKVIIKP